MNGFSRLAYVEAKLFLRETGAAIGVFGLPVALVVGFGLIPGFGDPQKGLSGQIGTEYIASISVAIVLAVLGLTGVPMFIGQYRERGILRRLGVTPVRPLTLLTADLMVWSSAAILSVATVIGVARLAYHVTAPQQTGWFILSLLLGIGALFALGLLVAAVTPTARSAAGLGPARLAGQLDGPNAATPVSGHNGSVCRDRGGARGTVLPLGTSVGKGERGDGAHAGQRIREPRSPIRIRGAMGAFPAARRPVHPVCALPGPQRGSGRHHRGRGRSHRSLGGLDGRPASWPVPAPVAGVRLLRRAAGAHRGARLPQPVVRVLHLDRLPARGAVSGWLVAVGRHRGRGLLHRDGPGGGIPSADRAADRHLGAADLRRRRYCRGLRGTGREGRGAERGPQAHDRRTRRGQPPAGGDDRGEHRAAGPAAHPGQGGGRGRRAAADGPG